MSEVKHTPEPWMADLEDYSSVVDSDGICVCEMPPYTRSPNREKARANAERIVACVNACRGINPEAVPLMLKTLQEAYRVLAESHMQNGELYWITPGETLLERLSTVIEDTTGQKPPVPSA